MLSFTTITRVRRACGAFIYTQPTVNLHNWNAPEYHFITLKQFFRLKLLTANI